MMKTTAFFYAAALFAHFFGLTLSQTLSETHMREAETELLNSLNALRSAKGKSACMPSAPWSKNARAMSVYKALILSDTYFHPSRPHGITPELTEVSTSVSLGHQCKEHRVALASAQSHSATVLCIWESNEAALEKLLSDVQYCGVSVVQSGAGDERFYWTLQLSNEQAPRTLLPDFSTKSEEDKLALAEAYWGGDNLSIGEQVQRRLKNIQNQKVSTIQLILDALHSAQVHLGQGADNKELHGVTASHDSPPHSGQTYTFHGKTFPPPSDRSVLHDSGDIEALHQQLQNLDDLQDVTYDQTTSSEQTVQPIQHAQQADFYHDDSPYVYQAHGSGSPLQHPSQYPSEGTPSASRESPYSVYPPGPRSHTDPIQPYSAPKSHSYPQLAPIPKKNPLSQQPSFPSCPVGYVLKCTSYSTTC